MGGMRGLQSGGPGSPTMDNLTDETAAGKAYDHRVVVRLLTYILPYRRDALIAIGAELLYTAGNVSIPLLMMFGITGLLTRARSGGST